MAISSAFERTLIYRIVRQQGQIDDIRLLTALIKHHGSSSRRRRWWWRWQLHHLLIILARVRHRTLATVVSTFLEAHGWALTVTVWHRTTGISALTTHAFMYRSINQSINQPINQPTNQSINESTVLKCQLNKITFVSPFCIVTIIILSWYIATARKDKAGAPPPHSLAQVPFRFCCIKCKTGHQSMTHGLSSLTHVQLDFLTEFLNWEQNVWG